MQVELATLCPEKYVPGLLSLECYLYILDSLLWIQTVFLYVSGLWWSVFFVTAALTFESTDLFNTVHIWVLSFFFLYDWWFLTCLNDVFKCILEEINRVFYIYIYIYLKKKTNVCASLFFGRTENTGKSWKKKEKKNTVWFLRFHFISTVLPFLANAAVFPPYLVNFLFFFLFFSESEAVSAWPWTGWEG